MFLSWESRKGRRYIYIHWDIKSPGFELAILIKEAFKLTLVNLSFIHLALSIGEHNRNKMQLIFNHLFQINWFWGRVVYGFFFSKMNHHYKQSGCQTRSQKRGWVQWELTNPRISVASFGNRCNPLATAPPWGFPCLPWCSSSHRINFQLQKLDLNQTQMP